MRPAAARRRGPAARGTATQLARVRRECLTSPALPSPLTLPLASGGGNPPAARSGRTLPSSSTSSGSSAPPSPLSAESRSTQAEASSSGVSSDACAALAAVNNLAVSSWPCAPRVGGHGSGVGSSHSTPPAPACCGGSRLP
eukprot:7099922-Prymnesium_polylepis.1